MSTHDDHANAQNMRMAGLSTFAERLKDALKASGKSPAEVYGALKVSKATWYTWAGQRESIPEPDTCLRLAALLGVSPQWLVSGKGQRQPVKKPYTQEQIDIAEAWPHLSPQAQKTIALLLREAVIEMAPQLESPLKSAPDELQDRANRLLTEAQTRLQKTRT